MNERGYLAYKEMDEKTSMRNIVSKEEFDMYCGKMGADRCVQACTSGIAPPSFTKAESCKG